MYGNLSIKKCVKPYRSKVILTKNGAKLSVTTHTPDLNQKSKCTQPHLTKNEKKLA